MKKTPGGGLPGQATQESSVGRHGPLDSQTEVNSVLSSGTGAEPEETRGARSSGSGGVAFADNPERESRRHSIVVGGIAECDKGVAGRDRVLSVPRGGPVDVC